MKFLSLEKILMLKQRLKELQHHVVLQRAHSMHGVNKKDLGLKLPLVSLDVDGAV